MPRIPSFPEDASTAHVFVRRPDIYAPFNQATEAIMRGESPLSPGERELIGAFVSGLNACGYCAGGHIAAAEAFGIAPNLLESLLQQPDAAPVDERMRPILAYVRKLTLTPSRLTDADANAVFAAGWTEAALHDAIAVCCLFSFMNRLVEGHGIRAIPERFAERGRRHQALGYVKQFATLLSGQGAAGGPGPR